MATTTRPISELAVGIRDTTGAVVASGKARFYLPGTLTPTAIYSDSVCTSAIVQPLTLNAGGQYISAYALEATRMIVKDSTETTTYYDGLVNVNRHDAVYVTHPSFNSGTETTLEAVLTSLGSNVGIDGNYLESAGATARTYGSWMGQLVVSVKDFGATGDGTTSDQTAIQAAYDRVKARGGGWVFWPVGTYKITAAITIDTAGVNTVGVGRSSIVKNFGTTTNAFTVNLGSAIDSKMVFRDISITANTTSSGAGISFTNGDKPVFQGVGVTLHRKGIDVGSVSSALLDGIIITSTDDNAAGAGVTLGSRGQIRGSEIACGTTNGTGISATGNDSRVIDCYTNKWATGVSLAGSGAQLRGGNITSGTTGVSMGGAGGIADGCYVLASTTGVSVTTTECMVRNVFTDTCTTGISLAGARSMAIGCTSTSGTTGVSLAAANTQAHSCVARSYTTGFSVGAFASVIVVGCVGSSNTTDLAVNASATLLIEHSNTFTTLSDSATTPHSWLKDRAKVYKVTKVTDSTATPSFTPTPQSCDIYICEMTFVGAVTAVAINATSTTGLQDGQSFTIILDRNAGSGSTATPAFNAQYNTTATQTAATEPTIGKYTVHSYVWRSGTSKWVQLNQTGGTVTSTSQAANW